MREILRWVVGILRNLEGNAFVQEEILQVLLRQHFSKYVPWKPRVP